MQTETATQETPVTNMNKHIRCTAANTTALMTLEKLVFGAVVSIVIAKLCRNYAVTGTSQVCGKGV